MSQFIYNSEFPAGPETTKRQQILFAADVEYAYSEDYEYIQDTNGSVFYMNVEGDLFECAPHITEEHLQSMAELDEAIDELSEPEEAVVAESDDYCITCHNIMLLDGIINNTLSRKEPITPQQADTMYKLAVLKQLLVEAQG